MNNDRVVFGLLYDKQERTFPFRWEAGRMTVLKGPNGRLQQADVSDRNTINDRGQIAATLIVAGQRQAVRWSPDGKATRLPALPGHTWTNAFSINERRRRLRLVAKAAERGRGGEPGALGRVRQGRPAEDRRRAAPTASPRRRIDPD